MRVLYFSPFMPWPANSGAALRTAGILRCLQSFAEVKCVCLGSAAAQPPAALAADFEVWPLTWPAPSSNARLDQWYGLWRYPSEAFARFISPATQQRLAALVRTVQPEVLLLESEFAAWPVPGWQPWLAAQPTAVVVSFLDVLSVVVERQAQALPRWGLYKLRQWVDAQKLRHFETRLLAGLDGALAMSTVDEQHLRRLRPQANVVVVPNGMEVPDVCPPARSVEPIILLVGTFSYAPNEAAFCFFVSQVFPQIRARLPQAQFWAAGKDATLRMTQLAAAQPGVQLVGGDGQVSRFYDEAAVAVAPILVGGGTRFKVLEAFARGVPVVSTTVGYEGITATPGRDLLVADEPTAMAQAILQLLQNPTQRATLMANGYQRAQAYDWRVIGRTLQTALQATVQRRSSA